MSEDFQPPRHVQPDTLLHKAQFYARLVADLQFCTIYRDARKFLTEAKGRVVDVGAGAGPFKHLLDENAAQYFGVDTFESRKFSYGAGVVTQFDGAHIPFASRSVDSFLCTEVLEHLPDPKQLVGEMHRILKPGGRGLVTVPWSARFHYIPDDYCRFTPTTLAMLFSEFSSVRIEPRGTDLTVIASKTVVAYLRLLVRRRKTELAFTILPAVLFVPFIVLALLLGHLSLLLDLGSSDDPLGYTVWVRKEGEDRQ